MAAPTTVLTIVKDMSYRGVAGEEWSNTYALTGTTPADSTAWRTLFDAVVAEEKKLYASSVRVIKGYGYDAIPEKGDHAIWTLDLRPSSGTVAGTLAATSGLPAAGDQAMWIRWSLDRFNTYGKRVYLRKYFHGGYVFTSTAENPSTAYYTALGLFGTKCMDGSLAGSRKICDKFGEVPIANAVAPYMTTRTLKRRGKRPPRPAP